jgi:hypothetical protein
MPKIFRIASLIMRKKEMLCHKKISKSYLSNTVFLRTTNVEATYNGNIINEIYV